PGGRAPRRDPLAQSALAWRGLVGGLGVGCAATALVATVSALKTMRLDPHRGMDLVGALGAIARPADTAGWVQLAGIAIVATAGGLFAAAVTAARHGIAPE